MPPYVNFARGSSFSSTAAALSNDGTALPKPPKPIPLVSCKRSRRRTRAFAPSAHAGSVCATGSSTSSKPSCCAATASTPQKLFVPL